MKLSASLILLVAALVCFVLAALQLVPRRGDLIALGLACWVGAQLVD